MKANLVRNWGHIGAYDSYGDLKITEGQCFGGFIAGILISESNDYKPTGHIANARSYPFGVRYAIVGSMAAQGAHKEEIAREIKEKALQLELEGCRFIVSSGGKFGCYQKLVADAVDLPVYMTPLTQLPWAKLGLKSAENVLVLSELSSQEAEEVFKVCGVEKEFYENCVFLKVNPETMDAESIIDYVERSGIVAQHKIRAVLLDTQIFAGKKALWRERFNVNVWDMFKLMGYVKSAVCQIPRHGFL